MKIGSPTDETPKNSKSSKNKYGEIYLAVRKLNGDKWLPVTFPTPHDAYNFRVAATTYRALKLEARLRGSEVYVRLKRQDSPKGRGK